METRLTDTPAGLSAWLPDALAATDGSGVYRSLRLSDYDRKEMAGILRKNPKPLMEALYGDAAKVMTDAQRAHETIAIELSSIDRHVIVRALESSNLPYQQVKRILDKLSHTGVAIQ